MNARIDHLRAENGDENLYKYSAPAAAKIFMYMIAYTMSVRYKIPRSPFSLHHTYLNIQCDANCMDSDYYCVRIFKNRESMVYFRSCMEDN